METSVIRERSVEEVEGEEHGNGWAIGAVCGLALLIMLAGIVAVSIAVLKMIF